MIVVRPVLAPSIMSTFVETQYSGTTIATATGFLVRKEDKAFLITNRHVVRGRHQETDAVLDKEHAAVPDSIRVRYLRESQYNLWDERTVPLYGKDSEPLWYEHPRLKGKVDVVALPLPELDGQDVLGYDPWAPARVLIDPSERLSIIGFPFGIISYLTMGVWVQGFVATQTQVNHERLPCFLIDSRTRKGQSGSPVIFYGNDYVSVSGVRTITNPAIFDLVGVYSGRISEQSDLGTVWKTEVIRDIVDAALKSPTTISD